MYCLCLLVSVTTHHLASGQVHCLEPLEVGELRILSSQLCVDTSGHSGHGNVAANYCNGEPDQRLIRCADGTVRNRASPASCLSTDASGSGNVVMSPCRVLNGIPAYQRWRVNATWHGYDVTKVKQMVFQLINEQSGLHLTALDLTIGRNVILPRGQGNLVAVKSGLRDTASSFFFR